jgi:glycerol-3-phosphate dehydrogenase
MWNNGWRNDIWANFDQSWDLIIIGGGITGTGILREAARLGLRALLLEANDFSSGTSSRSSKLVHGGFRYLANGQIKLVRQSVSERERLQNEGRGLVAPLGFLLTCFKRDPVPAWAFSAGLTFYDLLALKWGHRRYDAIDMQDLCPPLRTEGLTGGYRYFDAQTDDSRLVLRVIQEAVRDGGVALNYSKVVDLLKDRLGNVKGVAIEDRTPENEGRTLEIQAPVVINATGAWADQIRSHVDGRERLRLLRGSHLVFPSSRIPITRSVSFAHPRDNRYVFAFPWEGATLVGTTDVDHNQPLKSDVAISQSEIEYLFEAVEYAFPDLELTNNDLIATYSGVRPVIDTGKSDPSKESREHVLWKENGLLTVTGGKLTTFRLMAHDALQKIRSQLPHHPRFDRDERVFAEADFEFPSEINLKPKSQIRLLGRYGENVIDLADAAKESELELIPGTSTTWAELRWASRAEGVIHLDDLMLRRVRLGLLLPHGGLDFMSHIRSIVQPELGWSDQRWDYEQERYQNIWNTCYYF